MSRGQPLPPVLRATTMERPVNQDVNTDLLFPVNFSQQSCKFVFDKKGVLDSNSQLNLAQIVVNSAHADDTNSTLPTSTGALAMIRRAYLEIGGRRVSDLVQVGQYSTWKRLHFSNEYKKGIVQPKQGGNDVFVGSAARVIRATNDIVTQRTRGFGMPTGTLGRESSEFAVNDFDSSATYGTQQADQSDVADPPKRRITRDPNTTPSFAIGLGQLIPFLSGGVQIPLFAIREEVSLVIEWADPTFGHRFYPPQTDAAGNAQNAADCTSTIVENSVFMCVDYLFYPDLMAGLAEEIMQRGGFDVPYTEILTQENMLITGAGDGAFNSNFQLALGGKKVKHIIVQKELVDGANESINNLGRYNSLAFRLGEQIQLNIDSNNYYSRPLSNGSLQKHEADMVEASPLQLCDYRYSWFNQTDPAGAIGANDVGLSARLVNTYTNDSECGSQHWIGIKLENSFGQGMRMSNLPVIYTTQSKPGIGLAAADQDTQRRVRFFTGIQKVLNISQGIVTQIE
tara:strand:+ start:6208 stop:7743 length:1536 start_codon:yes stop_codon:yes gene_type:complete